jgi:hypothetical protein
VQQGIGIGTGFARTILMSAAVATLRGPTPIDLFVDQGMEGRKTGRCAEIVARFGHSD